MKRVLMFDAIRMQGGSKIANAEILKQCDSKNVVSYIATTHPEHWKSIISENSRIHIIRLKHAPLISDHGLTYWMINFFYMIQLFFLVMKLPKLDWLLGLSCPSNDMPLYLLRLLTRKPIVQIIHGPVPCARSTGYCLIKASAIFYLASTKDSLVKALQAYLKVSSTAVERYWTMLETSTFTNGLSPEKWPKQANTISKRVFWAASLLKWKNLDLLIEAITLDTNSRIEATVCYLKPTVKALSEPDFSLKQIEWHESPSNLDQLRSQCGIFVSTSINEPFGLSILEALAAGMCVVVPCDDSYWDRVLTHGKNCIKYTPNDAVSLHNAIHLLNEAPWLKVTMGIEALSTAQLYTADRCYFPIIDYLQNNKNGADRTDINNADRIKGYDHV
ncbi:glycosyltransferase [Vibrio azureus]|uniref:Glycosyl transferase family 1 domain-containing protein n=1 Tax=Vibrio azureus NBRC 104587 TaxID=1219077 RepID=U3BY90_9VIBR|nr:glycosyltransferase family 4 protein [Vibrio azureus]AUI85987.1 glycosyltransferase [Vibrio azureus]GAD74294.1 hypothetical protein VAZ01S_008_00350 [Vibrio azureus NBRC 104587]